MNNQNLKDRKIESLRGLALILMVAGHVIGSSPDSGIRAPDDSTLRYLYDSLIHIRMPLFTAISGYVYGLRPVTTSRSAQRLLRGKAYRIGIPLLVVSLLFFLAQSLIPGTNESPDLDNIVGIFFYGYAHFWFLQAILLIFMAIAFLEIIQITQKLEGMLLILILSLFTPLAFSQPIKLFSFYRALDLFPFFIIGLFICRFPEKITGALWSSLPVSGLLLFAIYQAHLLSMLRLPDNWVDILGVGLGACAVYTLITYRFNCAPLEWLGNYSFEVYLFHVFGTAGARMLLNLFEIYSTLTVFTFSLLTGLLLPIALKLMTQPHAIPNLLLFGSKSGPITQSRKIVSSP